MSLLWFWVSYQHDYVEERHPVQRVQRLLATFHCSPEIFIIFEASIHSYCLCGRTCACIDSGWILFGLWEWFVKTLFASFPNSLPVTLISCSSCPVMVVGTDLEWLTQLNSPLSAWTVFLSSTTQMCMLSPSWPHYITSTILSNNLTRNDAQTPETQQLLEPPIPFCPHTSAFCSPLPTSFFTAKL